MENKKIKVTLNAKVRLDDEQISMIKNSKEEIEIIIKKKDGTEIVGKIADIIELEDGE